MAANTKFQVRRTSVSGRTPNTTASYATNSQYIAAGEFALNMSDRILYTSDGTNLITVGANQVNQNVTGNVYIGNSSVNTVANSTTIKLSNSTVNTLLTIPSSAQYSATNVFLHANGSWVTVTGGSVNVDAQYVWTNTHTFNANVSFAGNGASFVTNTGAVYFNGMSDANWKIGRNTGATTKFYYTNNSLDIIAANSNLEGIAFGWTGNSYFEIGYVGAFTRLPIYVGNTVSNTKITNTSITIANSTTTTSISLTDIRVGNTSTNVIISNTSSSFGGDLTVSGNTIIQKGLSANGGYGSANQVLTSNGSVAYWATPASSTANVQTFTGNGTWNKPASGSIALIRIWGGGGSGGKDTASSKGGGGGGGGGYVEVWYPLSSLNSTETVTIGQGGAARSATANGAAGGTSSFGTTPFVYAYGGGGGGGPSSTYYGGGGGGQISAGSGQTAGSPINLSGTGGSAADPCTGNGTDGNVGSFGGGGGGGGNNGRTNGSAGSGGGSVWGGGGGGGRATGTGTNGSGGTSRFAGNGGAGGATGTDGTFPAGGGGGSTTGNSGAGANGQCIVYVF